MTVIAIPPLWEILKVLLLVFSWRYREWGRLGYLASRRQKGSLQTVLIVFNWRYDFHWMGTWGEIKKEKQTNKTKHHHQQQTFRIRNHWFLQYEFHCNLLWSSSWFAPSENCAEAMWTFFWQKLWWCMQNWESSKGMQRKQWMETV